ncbi:MAG: iron-sulfur cluster assembly scaffold protein [Nanoarchaeota archaeon]|nr:iron-sulfur cluster assembly scaffold protein [Nanoarchaeota archaeon]
MEYSDKVIEHFQKPHNMGELPDADAIGKVGNAVCGDMMWIYIKVEKNEKGKEILKDVKFKTFGCLPPEEKIVANNGDWKKIAQMNKGEEVINNFGNNAKIVKTYEINYKGPMLSIIPFVSPYNSFSVTPEHPVLSVKRKWFKTRTQNPYSKWPRILDSNFLKKEPEFVDAKKLEEGDYLVFSYNQEIKNNEFFTKEWLRLIGYYLSEGYITAEQSVVNFAFNKKENEPINDVKKSISKILGKKCSQRTRENVTEVYVCSRKLARLLLSFAGNYASKKKISQELMILPPEKQMEIIKTFYIGDGDKTTRRKGNSPTFRLATASEDLAIQFQKILARNGIFSSIIRRQRRKKQYIGEREIKGKDLFIVSYKKKRKNNFVHKRKNNFLVPIKRIEKSNYEGYVYNLHVDKSPNSYLVKGFAVHNCVAAIATSSMITDLAVGKTLDEAEKLTKKDVSNALGSLPPIKEHCSNLAAEGLHEAIKNYRTKVAVDEEKKFEGCKGGACCPGGKAKNHSEVDTNAKNKM